MSQAYDSQPVVTKNPAVIAPAAVRMAPSEQLAGYLQQVRQRLLRREKLRVLLLWLQAVLVCGSALLVMAAQLGPSWLWLPSLAMYGVVSLIALFVVQVRTTKERTSDDAMARYVGAQLPDLRSELLSSVELLRESMQPSERALVEELTSRTVAALGTVKPATLVDWGPIQQAAATGLLLLLFGLFSTVIGLLPLAKGLQTVMTISPPEPVLVATEPLLGDIRLLLVYPKYTGLHQRTIPGSTGDIMALPGTQVRIEAWALVPVERAQLVMVTESGQTSQPVQVGKPKAGQDSPMPLLSASLTVQKPGSYYFVIKNGHKALLREGQSHRISVEADHPPRIDLFAPATELEVTSTRRIELAYSAEDDFGLGDIDLVYRIGTGGERRRRLRSATTADSKPEDKSTQKSGLVTPTVPRNLAAKIEWDLSELELQPGVRVTYVAESRDLNNVSGPGVGRSREYALFIQSPRQRQEALLQSQAQLREQAVQLLADRIDLLRALGKDSPELTSDGADRAQAVHRKSETFLLLIGRVQQDSARGERPAKDLLAALQEIADRLGKLNQEEATLLQDLRKAQAKGSPRTSRSFPREVYAQSDRHVLEMERDVLHLDDLIGRQRLEELLSIGDEMAQLRDRMRQLLAEHKKHPSDALRREIERELRAFERRIAELAEKARALSDEVPDEFMNREALGQSDMQSRIDRLRDMLQKGDLQHAQEELERMSQSLDQLVRGMEQSLQGYRRERFSAEEKALAELENQLADLSHDQQQLKRRTEEVRQSASARARQLLRDRADAFSRRLLPDIQKLRRLLADVDVDPLGPWGSDEMAKVEQRLDDVLRMLEQGDLEEAKAMAQEAEGSLGRIEEELRGEEQAARWGQRQRLAKSRSKAEQGKAIAHDMASELDRALPRPEDLMNPSERRQLGELRAGQEQLRKRSGEFLRELQKRARDTKDAPQLERLSNDAQGVVKKASSFMEQSEGELRRLVPRSAASAQGQALDQLSQLRKEMQNARRPHSDGMGMRSEREPIKIPGADEYRPPKEFRKDILDAAKREPPSEYREQVRRYYEELIQ
ncbi:MAG: hypothetical protein JNM83_25235 [Myxococcales bacterium]|nr:hypothetical protein [Myxococcales bacterium]